MRSQLHRLLVSTGLAAATLMGTAASSSAQVVRDHRHKPPEAEAEAAPREAPPPPREERHDTRRQGFAWINGRWDWRRREHKWDWIPGHWEQVPAGATWAAPRYVTRDGAYFYEPGTWNQSQPAGHGNANAIR